MIQRLLLLLFSAALLNSCVVAKKKYLLETDTRRAAEQRESVLREELAYNKNQVETLTNRVAELSRTNGTLEYINNNLRIENEDMRSRVQNLATASSSEIEQLQRRLRAATDSLAQRERIIQELQQAVQARLGILDGLLARLDTTLRFYAPDGVKVESVEGNAIVILPADALFTPNGDRLTRKGLDIIARIGPLLEGNPNIDILVEGHTDNTRPRNRNFADNWAVSTDQATAVLRVFTKDFAIAASQTAAVGRSEFMPRASNATAGGQAQNRRIEIVISPKTAGLIRLMDRRLSGG